MKDEERIFHWGKVGGWRTIDARICRCFLGLYLSSFLLFYFYENLSITMLSPLPPFISTTSMRANLTGVRLLLVADATSALIGSYDRYTWDFSHVRHRQSLSHQKETPPVTPWAWCHPARFQFARREEYSRWNPRSHWLTGVTTLIAMEVRKGTTCAGPPCLNNCSIPPFYLFIFRSISFYVHHRIFHLPREWWCDWWRYNNEKHLKLLKKLYGMPCQHLALRG